MATISTFDARVAARTRAAAQILQNKELLTIYQSHGGLRDDLEAIRSHGQKAEALSHARSGGKTVEAAATLSVLSAFSDLQKDYTAVMAVVQAVRLDLLTAGAPEELVQTVERILKNEAPVVYRPDPAAPLDAEGKGKPKRKAVQSSSQESLRAEIHKDAVALLGLTDIHLALKRRGIPTARLTALRDAAQALTSQLSNRSTKKGAGKAATDSLHAAVTDQKAVWSACYRILDAAAQEDSRIRQLLKDSMGKR